MNPLHLPGPAFLVVYSLLVVFVLAFVWVLRWRMERGDPGPIPLDAPSSIAVLRGGPDAGIQVALVSLVDRGYLVSTGDVLRRTDKAADPDLDPVERNILERIEGDLPATALFVESVRTLFAENTRSLIERKLLPGSAGLHDRRVLAGVCILFMGVTAALRTLIALVDRRENSTYVVLLFFLAWSASWVVGYVALHSRRTGRGDRALAEWRNSLGSWGGVPTMGPGFDARLVAATFGVSMLPRSRYPWARELFPRAQDQDQTWSEGSEEVNDEDLAT